MSKKETADNGNCGRQKTGQQKQLGQRKRQSGRGWKDNNSSARSRRAA